MAGTQKAECAENSNFRQWMYEPSSSNRFREPGPSMTSADPAADRKIRAFCRRAAKPSSIQLEGTGRILGRPHTPQGLDLNMLPSVRRAWHSFTHEQFKDDEHKNASKPRECTVGSYLRDADVEFWARRASAFPVLGTRGIAYRNPGAHETGSRSDHSQRNRSWLEFHGQLMGLPRW